jgi:hypothetical protein
VITSKDVAAAPQYTVVIREWKTDVQPGADDFVFKPPSGARQLDVRALSSFDEVPPEAVRGGKK